MMEHEDPWFRLQPSVIEGLEHLSLVDGTMSPAADDVLLYSQPTPSYCCSLSANAYGIEFESFRIRDYDSDQLLFEVAQEPGAEKVDLTTIPPEYEDQVRCISYDFGAAFLDLKTIGTTLTFSVGNQEIPNFRMIERHYFRDTLLRSFDFHFGFCIPNSTNTWEAIYDMPELDPELKQLMIDNPWETQSDSFYYVGDEMVLHNKAKYAYTE